MKAMQWERKPLGEVADLCLGKMLDQNKNRGEPFLYLANVNVRWGEFDLCDLRSMRFEPKEMDRYGLKLGDIVMCEGGEPGRCAIWKDQVPGMMIQKALHRIRPKRCLDYRFLFYSFLYLGKSKVFDQYFTGATIKHLPGEKLAKIEVDIPPLSIQQRIASILSDYDELIENNQRRIKILESMARALYREWFVHFRFPGHESIPRVSSHLGDIPQGWEATTLGEHLVALESGKRPKGGIRDESDGVPSIGAENINGIGLHNFVSEKLIPREFFRGMRKGVVLDRDVAIYKDGAYIGKSTCFRDGFPHSECCVNEHVFLLRSSGERLKQNALYLWLQEPDTVQTIRLKNTNAAQPGINQQTVCGLELILPDSTTAANFDKLIDPFLAEIISLAKKVQNLRRTRDLLLPRLLSGQIDVEAIAA